MALTLSELLPYTSQHLAAYCPPKSRRGYASRDAIAFDVSSNMAWIEDNAWPEPLACINNWLQMGVPHTIPETVMALVVKHNQDERKALVQLARLMTLVVRVLASYPPTPHHSAMRIVVLTEGYDLEEAFHAHWAMLCAAFAPAYTERVSLRCTKIGTTLADEEADVMIALVDAVETTSSFLPYLEQSASPYAMIAYTASERHIRRKFIPLTSTIVFQSGAWHSLVEHVGPSHEQAPPHAVGEVLCISSMLNFLARWLYPLIPSGKQILIVVPHDLALSMTRLCLQRLGIDAISSIGHATPTGSWIDKWTAMLSHQHLVMLCTTSQLLHPFWKECAPLWQPACILYTEAQQLSPWTNPSHTLEEVCWKRLKVLFPNSCIVLQAETIRQEDIDYLHTLMALREVEGEAIRYERKANETSIECLLVAPILSVTKGAYHRNKQYALKSKLSDYTTPWAILCPHTKGSIGVEDGIYQGVATFVKSLLHKDQSVSHIADAMRYDGLERLYTGHVQGVVAFCPLQRYVLPHVACVYTLDLPTSIGDLWALQQCGIPICFILADDKKVEIDMLRFRLGGSFAGVERDFTLCMLLLKIIVEGVQLSLSYPSEMSQYLDESLVNLGHTPIGKHHSEGDRAQRYQYVVLQALATLHVAGCISEFSYCLDRALLEATPSLPVDTYQLRLYIEHRYATYYPWYNEQFERIAEDVYALVKSSSEHEDNVPTDKQTFWMALWQWLMGKIKDRT